MKCKHCDFETPMVSDFRHHMYLKHDAKKPNFHRCEKCNEKFYNFDDLLTHRRECQFGGADAEADHGNHEDISDPQENSDQVDVKVEILRVPLIKVERLTAETFAQHSKAILTPANCQKVRVCVICKLHISHKNLLTHIRAMHVNFNTFKCTLCVKGFNDKTSLNNHILQHHTKVRPFLCNLCGSGFSAKKYVVPHVLGCLKSNWIKCKTATQTSQGSAEDYIQEIAGAVPCPMCKAICTDYASLIEHMKRHRIVYPGDKVKVKVETEKKLHQCEVCSMKFSDLVKLVNHKRLHQQSTGVAAKRFRKKLKQSKQIKIKGNNIPSLDVHIKPKKSKKSAKRQDISQNKPILEPESNAKPLALNGYDAPPNHMEINGIGTKKIHLCSYFGCQYATNNDANLRRHKKTVHKESQGSESVRDQIIHYCHLCAYETNQQGNLIRHLANKHDIGDIVKCDFCPFEAFSKEKIKTHMKSAHNVKPTTTCKHCNVEFKTHYDMKCHQWQHLRNNTSCDGLPYAKPKSRSKKAPQKKVKSEKIDKSSTSPYPGSPNKFFICDECGKSFIRKRYLQKHIDCVHPKSDEEEDVDMSLNLETAANTDINSIPASETNYSTSLSDANFLMEPEQYEALHFISQQTRVIEIDAI